MPSEIFLFLAANWCDMVDSGGCCWGKFSALWSQRGGGGVRPSRPPPPPQMTGLLCASHPSGVKTQRNTPAHLAVSTVNVTAGVIHAARAR